MMEMGRTPLKLLLQGPMKEVNDSRFYLSAKCGESTSVSFVSRTEIISMQQVVMKLGNKSLQLSISICFSKWQNTSYEANNCMT